MSGELGDPGLSLRGQVALVTGGSRGIGRALAMALAQSGAAVAVVARTQSHVAKTVADIAQANGRAVGVVVDVTDRHAVERMVREVEDKLGPVDLLINNAAVVSPLGAISEVDPEAWWRTQEINVRGPMLCARGASGNAGPPRRPHCQPDHWDGADADCQYVGLPDEQGRADQVYRIAGARNER